MDNHPTADTLRHLLQEFYTEYNLGENGGIQDSKVTIEVTKSFHFYIPNFDDRRKAVLKHDIHHLITGYKSDFKGETEIAAWEIASGCTHYWVGWALDLSSFALGIFFTPRGIFRAFVRGLRSGNLYYDQVPDEQALNSTVPELQQLFHIPPKEEKLKANVKEILLFIFWLSVGGVYSFASIAILPLIVAYNVYLAINSKRINIKDSAA